jgi:pimeloyl-ACP methyl ester carboxylesterase
LEINGLDISYNLSGDPNNQPLVFIHGLGIRKDDLYFVKIGTRRLIEELSKHYFVLAPIIPGLLGSQIPSETWGLKDYSSCLNQLITKLNIQNPIIVGQSWGGQIAAHYAHLYRDSLKSLILVDSMLLGGFENWYINFYRWLYNLDYKYNKDYVPFIIKKIILSLSFGIPWKDIDKHNIEEKFKIYQIIRNMEEERQLFFNYSDITCPIHLIWSEKDTYITPQSIADLIKVEAPRAKLIKVRGGHFEMYKRPETVVNAILNILD